MCDDEDCEGCGSCDVEDMPSEIEKTNKLFSVEPDDLNKLGMMMWS